MILGYLSNKNKTDDEHMTRDRIAELEKLYPDGPRKSKHGGRT